MECQVCVSCILTYMRYHIEYQNKNQEFLYIQICYKIIFHIKTHLPFFVTQRDFLFSFSEPQMLLNANAFQRLKFDQQQINVEIILFMERFTKSMIDDQFFGSGYKIQTTSSLASRQLANQFQIEQLTVPEKLNPLERTKYILDNGSNFQIWSLFENLISIIKDHRYVSQIIQLLMKTTKEYPKQLLKTLGYGVAQFLEKSSFNFSEEEISKISNLTFKIFDYEEPEIADEWVKVAKFIYTKNSSVLNRVQEYACKSFDLKSSQHRRRVGIMLIEEFFEHSQKFHKQTIKKLLLFSRDQNKNCRQSICNALGKFLKVDKNQQVWKVVLDYSEDKDSDVRICAYRILTSIHRSHNFQIALSLFEKRDSLALVNSMLPQFLKVYSNQIRDQSPRNMFLNMVNGSLINKNQGLSKDCIDNIIILTRVYGIKFLNDLSESIIKASNYQERNGYNNFIILFSKLNEQQRLLEFRNIFYQILKLNNYNFQETSKQILGCLSTDSDSDLDICIKLCSKSLELCQWNADKDYLESLKKWKLHKSFFDRVVLLVIKHLSVCPQSLNQTVFETIRHLLCVGKKRRDFLLTLKQKMANNKCWVQRRNFIQMYEYLYKNCSWQMMSQICPLPQYIFINEKVLNIKLEHCKFISNVYEFLSLGEQNIKETLKQYLVKYSEDKNPLLMEYAGFCLKSILKWENTTKAEELFKRNKQLFQQQIKFQQLQDQPQIKQIVSYKALVNSKMNQSTSKKSDLKKHSINMSKDSIKPFPTQVRRGIARNSAVVKSPTIPITLNKIVKKSDKK